MGQKQRLHFAHGLFIVRLKITGERVLYPYDLHLKYAAEQTAVYWTASIRRFSTATRSRLPCRGFCHRSCPSLRPIAFRIKNGACTAYIKRGAQGLGFENVNTFIRVFKEPLNKSPTADDGSFPPILRFEKREIHTVFHRFSNLVLTKNLSPSTAADLIRTSLRALRAFRPAFTRKRF